MKDECLFYKQSELLLLLDSYVFGDFFADEMENNFLSDLEEEKRIIFMGTNLDEQVNILCTDIILSEVEPLIKIEDYDALITIFEVVVNMIIRQAISALRWKCNFIFYNGDCIPYIKSKIQKGKMIYSTINHNIELKVTKILDRTIKGVEGVFNQEKLIIPDGLIECLKCISDVGISSWRCKGIKSKEEKKKNAMYVLSTKCKITEQYIGDKRKSHQYKLARKFVKDNNIYLPQMYMMFFNTLSLIKKCKCKEYPLIRSNMYVDEKYEVVKNSFQPGSIYESILYHQPYNDSRSLMPTDFFSGMLPSFVSERKLENALVSPRVISDERMRNIGCSIWGDSTNEYTLCTNRTGLDNIAPEEKNLNDYIFELPATFFYIPLTISLNEDIETIEKYCRVAISGLPNLIEKFKKEKGIKSDKEIYTKARMTRKAFEDIKKGIRIPNINNMVELAKALRLTREEALFFWGGIEDRKSEADKKQYIQSLENNK